MCFGASLIGLTVVAQCSLSLHWAPHFTHTHMLNLKPTQKDIFELLRDIERQSQFDRYTIGRYDERHIQYGDGKFYYDKQVTKFRKLVEENRITDRDYMSMFMTVAIIDAMVLGI